jgi:prepilin-type N-terminal cleavage/methylation domain-containing protein
MGITQPEPPQGESAMTKVSKKSGFTLVEIMIVVAIIGLLAAIAIPSFIKARTESQTKSCINNLRIQDAAKEQAAIEQGWATGDPITAGSSEETNALEYVKGGAVPTCAANGTYTWGNIGVDPSCTVTGHTL